VLWRWNTAPLAACGTLYPVARHLPLHRLRMACARQRAHARMRYAKIYRAP